jgi:DNA-binding transcriptional ArsR family regulator
MTKQKFSTSSLDKAFRHPLRRRILLRVMATKDGASPKELAVETEEPPGNVSYHFKVLKEGGLIRLDRREPRRGAVEHFYVAAPGLTPKIEAEVALDSLAELMEGQDGFLDEAALVAEIVQIVRATGRPVLLSGEGS